MKQKALHRGREYFLSLSERQKLAFFLVTWGALNLLQAAFTPLHNDEAYYWMYSRYPDWGYYDHPPMTAFLILIGYVLIKGELGVRLLVVAAELATLLLAWELTDEEARKKKGAAVLFASLVLLLPLFHVYGFIAVPDAPLLLFTALFLLLFRKFNFNPGTGPALLLGAAMACLVYSKYHGALVILLAMASAPAVLRKPAFYMSVLFSLLLFLPHIAWQYNNSFPSMQYHLVDRVEGINLANVPEYLLNQLAVHNPVLILLLVYIIIRKPMAGLHEKTLRYIVAGFLVFFFISSFRYHVEPHWTAAISLPLLVLLFNSAGVHWNHRKILKPLLYLVIPLLLLGRFALVFDILPSRYLEREFHGTEKRMKHIKEVAGGRPVVFTNSYQDPSQYTFITGGFAHSLNNLAYRRSQFDLWDFEERLHGKEVLYVPHWLTPEYKRNLEKFISAEGDSLFARIIPDFRPLQRQCIIIENAGTGAGAGEPGSISIALFNPYSYAIDIDHPLLPLRFQAAFFKDGRLAAKQNLLLPQDFSFPGPGDTIRFSAQFTIPILEPGEYMFGVTSEAGFLLDVLSSNIMPLSPR